MEGRVDRRTRATFGLTVHQAELISASRTRSLGKETPARNAWQDGSGVSPLSVCPEAPGAGLASPCELGHSAAAGSSLVAGAHRDETGHRSDVKHRGGRSRSLSCCLLYTSDAADERSSVDLGGRRIIKKKK